MARTTKIDCRFCFHLLRNTCASSNSIVYVLQLDFNSHKGKPLSRTLLMGIFTKWYATIRIADIQAKILKKMEWECIRRTRQWQYQIRVVFFDDVFREKTRSIFPLLSFFRHFGWHFNCTSLVLVLDSRAHNAYIFHLHEKHFYNFK